MLGFGVGDLPDVLAWAQRLGFDGLNVTHPFKQAVVPLLDELSDDAADLGAVNTVVFRDGRALGPQHRLVGLRPGVPRGAARRRAGPGRAGRRRRRRAWRSATACCEQGAEHVAVLDADRDRADACAVRLAKRFGDDRVTAVARPRARRSADAQGLVNATPIGMLGHPGMAVPGRAACDDGLWVSDVVYFPLETELVRLARSRGCRVVPGGGMAVHQAVGAFEYFTGRVPDADADGAALPELTR